MNQFDLRFRKAYLAGSFIGAGKGLGSPSPFFHHETVPVKPGYSDCCRQSAEEKNWEVRAEASQCSMLEAEGFCIVILYCDACI